MFRVLLRSFGSCWLLPFDRQLIAEAEAIQGLWCLLVCVIRPCISCGRGKLALDAFEDWSGMQFYPEEDRLHSMALKLLKLGTQSQDGSCITPGRSWFGDGMALKVSAKLRLRPTHWNRSLVLASDPDLSSPSTRSCTNFICGHQTDENMQRCRTKYWISKDIEHLLC